MILDNNLIFCEKKSLSDSESTSDVIDLRAGGGVTLGELIVEVVMDDEAAAGGTDFRFEFETSDTENFASSEVCAATPTFLTADATEYSRLIAFNWPRKTKRYVRAKATTTGDFTAGKYSIFAVTGDHTGLFD